MTTYDLRSDTVTRPSAGMRKAMAEAEVGDDVYGEDPTVNRLQEMAAEITGQGSRAVRVHGIHGQPHPHLPQLWQGQRASHRVPRSQRPARARRRLSNRWKPSHHDPRPPRSPDPRSDGAVDPARHLLLRPHAMIVVENTHNVAGAPSIPLSLLQEIGTFARKKSLSLHMDGARLFNAVVASGVPPAHDMRGNEYRDVLPLQGAGGPGRCHALRDRGLHCGGPARAQDAGGRDAAGGRSLPLPGCTRSRTTSNGSLRSPERKDARSGARRDLVGKNRPCRSDDEHPLLPHARP